MEFLFKDRGPGKRSIKPSKDAEHLEALIQENESDDSDFELEKHKRENSDHETDSDGGKSESYDGSNASVVKGKLFKINISMREKDLANKQLSPSQLSSILLNQKQLERVAKTSKLPSTPKQSQRLALSHKKPVQAHLTPKQDEKSLKTSTAKDQEAKASGPDTSQSGRIRKVKKIFDL